MTALPVPRPAPRLEAPGVALPRPPYPVDPQALPDLALGGGAYRARFARTRAELDRVLRLRFEVFNVELGEGLASAFQTGRDEDALDARFHHLMIVHEPTGEVVGTYRMQTAEMAARHGGFYSSGEYDLSAVPEAVLARSVEIGRACVARAHRNGRTLLLLWRGLAQYLAWNGKSVLFGCCSLPGQDELRARAVEDRLRRAGHGHPSLRVPAQPDAACAPAPAGPMPAEPEVPPLFESYLQLGAQVWSEPAVDRAFNTIDFLVGLDTNALAPRARRSLFA